jgi:hypothetical protein
MSDASCMAILRRAKPHRPGGAKRSLLYLSIITVVITLAVFAVETLVDEPGTAIALLASPVLAVVVDWFWRYVPALRSPGADSASAALLTR